MDSVNIVPLERAIPLDVYDMLHEHCLCGEVCKPLDFMKDPNTKLYVIIACGETVGMLRQTRKLIRMCHGMIGISVRPKKRGCGYGVEVLNYVRSSAEGEGETLTACIDRTNKTSIFAFEKAGWVPSGILFQWKGDRIAAEYVTTPQIAENQIKNEKTDCHNRHIMIF